MYGLPATILDPHGDEWVARIRAEHERLGMNCPCWRSRLSLDFSAFGALPADTNTPRLSVSCDLPRRDHR